MMIAEFRTLKLPRPNDNYKRPASLDADILGVLRLHFKTYLIGNPLFSNIYDYEVAF